VADLGVDHDLASAGLPALPRTAWLRVDLDRLVGNLAALRAAVPTGVSVEPVVKADAYGHGAVPVARALEDAGANGLCVATFDEGIELRRRGVRLPILVLFPAPPWVAREAADLHISLTVGDPALLARTLEAWASSDGEVGGRAASLQLEVEVESGLAILTGDVAYLADPGVTQQVPSGYWVDLGDVLAALARIKRDATYVLPTHDPAVHEQYGDGLR